MNAQPLRVSRGTRLAMLALAAAIVVLVAFQVTLRGGSAPAAPRPWPAPTRADTYPIGVTTLPLTRNSWRPWQPSNLVSVNAFEQAIKRHVAIVTWYADWAHEAPLLAQLRAVAARRSIPEISWEPWDALHPVRDQPKYRLANIVAGRFDPYIRTWARTIAAYGKPVRLRFAQEMNGRWYPWSEAANRNHSGEFADAWRHVHAIFDRAGATNVRWIWSPAAIAMSAEQYPGDREVDIVSLSVFNGGSQLRYSRWRSFAAIVHISLERLHSIAPGKPVEYSEVGCADRGGSRSAWIRAMLGTLEHQPHGTALIWFDVSKVSDWRIENSRGASTAFAAGLDSAELP